MLNYITYQDKKYPVRISYYVLRTATKSDDIKDISQLMNADISVFERILWGGLQAGCRFERKELDIKEDDIAFVLDECFDEFLEILPQFFDLLVKMTERVAGSAEQMMDKVPQVQKVAENLKP